MKLNLAIILSISLPATHYHGTKDSVKLNLRAVVVPSTHENVSAFTLRSLARLKELYGHTLQRHTLLYCTSGWQWSFPAPIEARRGLHCFSSPSGVLFSEILFSNNKHVVQYFALSPCTIAENVLQEYEKQMLSLFCLWAVRG